MNQEFKEITLGDQQPFARGGTGECFRLDEDTILKLYYEGVPMERVQQEKDGARAAQVAGVPTAISFHKVRVGTRYGVIYELVQGRTMSEMIAAAPSKAAELGREFANIAFSLHRAEVKNTDLPSSIVLYREVLGQIQYAPAEVVQRIGSFLDDLEQEKHYVHGDFQPNNVIVTRDGPMLLDMGDFSIGSPVLDVATTYFSMFESPEARKGGRSAFNGLSPEEARAFWEGFADEYYDGKPDPEAERKLMKVVALKKMLFEYFFGKYFSPSYCEDIRREMLEMFEKE